MNGTPPDRDYDRLERSDRAPKRVVDHSAKWAKLEPVANVNGQTEELIKVFCDEKNITVGALEALGARVAYRRGGKLELAFAGDNGAGAVTAIKYRPIDGTSHDSTAEAPRPGCGRSSSGNTTRSTGSSPKAKQTPPASTTSSGTSPRSWCSRPARAPSSPMGRPDPPWRDRRARHDADEDGTRSR